LALSLLHKLFIFAALFFSMIEFKRYKLDNGLTVLVHEDKSSPLVAFNLSFNVGSRDESIEKTGLAHLFEHLMFSGSENVKDFDEIMQLAGGENNAFTNCDMTSFYDIIPAENIETVFWLESDRMMSLNLNQRSLDIQKKVVIEEFKETCLNEPYGDMWHHLTEMAYQQHPYMWPTIGKEIDHIEKVKLDESRTFFNTYYQPNNAILSVAGNIKPEKVFALAQEWFSEIPSRLVPERKYAPEPIQQTKRFKELSADVPLDTFFTAFHMCGRNDPKYYATDLLSDILASGRSSRFYQNLYKGKGLFSQIDAYISASFDPGLLIIEGRPEKGVDLASASYAVWEELEQIKKEGILKEELEKVKNKAVSGLVLAEVNILNKAINLAYYELLGGAEMINDQKANYQNVSAEDIHMVANELFQKSNECTLFYKAKSQN
jgi:predicted Zn-dependent peptidase